MIAGSNTIFIAVSEFFYITSHYECDCIVDVVIATL